MFLSSKSENGSTMVEMLGYLAIFALLSAGVYAGYSSASRRIKIDRTVNAVHDVIQDIRTAFGAKRFYSKLTWKDDSAVSFGDVLIKEDIISKKFCVNLTPAGCESDLSKCNCAERGIAGEYVNEAKLMHPLGGGMYITLDTATGNKPGEFRKFAITLDDVTEKTCMPLATQNWNGTGETVNVIESLTITDSNKSQTFTNFPLNMGDVKDYCLGKGTRTLKFLVR